MARWIVSLLPSLVVAAGVAQTADPLREARDAVEMRQTDRLKRMLAADPGLARRADAFGFTLLHRVRRPEEAGILLSHGANLEARNRYGSTPLLEACRRDLPEVVRFLLSRKANALATMDNGSGALHLAAESAGARVVELLVAAKVPVNARDRSGRTPLHRAAQAGNVERHPGGETQHRHACDQHSQPANRKASCLAGEHQRGGGPSAAALRCEPGSGGCGRKDPFGRRRAAARVLRNIRPAGGVQRTADRLAA